jgi:exopolysaccharide biosynthesis polyprenyl glycosylphosphotransferase
MLPRLTKNLRLRPLLALFDGVAILVAIYLAHLIRFYPTHFTEKWVELTANPGLLIWALVSYWALAAAAELFEPHVFHRRWEVVLRVTVLVIVWSAGLVLATYAQPDWAYGRGLLLLTSLLTSPLLLIDRRLVASWIGQRRRTPALVIGASPAVKRFCRDLEARPGAAWKGVDGSALAPEEVGDRVKELGATIILVAESNGTKLVPLDLASLHFAGVPVVAAVDLWAWLDERLPLDSLSPELVLHQPGLGAVHWHGLHRLTVFLDFFLAALLLVLTAPVMLVAVVLVALFDGFPVFYRQQRLGEFGRPFEILKFRTMGPDSEPEGPRFADEDDPRVTRLGSIFRRLRIDELPQLLNVLRGEMALVGPRPERPGFATKLAQQIPCYTFRLAVRPGITGWAQVNTSYARDVTGHRRKLEFDLYYVRESSLRLYLLTLLRTLSATLVGNRRPTEASPTGPDPIQEPLKVFDDTREIVPGADPLPTEAALPLSCAVVIEKP